MKAKGILPYRFFLFESLKSGILSQLLLASVINRQKSSVYEVFFAAFEQEELLFPFPMPVLNCFHSTIICPFKTLAPRLAAQLPAARNYLSSCYWASSLFPFPMPVLNC
ncbi:MAG: hypothetical protein KKF79_02055 [Gammaproteobacteria bacterium]|nr:hypothetical protein [Gammaproteobacteria bacterium]